MEKNEFENFNQRKDRGHVYTLDLDPEKRKEISELEEIKNRMRKEFNLRQSSIKESFFEEDN